MQRDYIQREINRATQVLLAVLGLLKGKKMEEALQLLRDEVSQINAVDFETQNDLAKLWKIQGDLSETKKERQNAYQNALKLYESLILNAPFFDMNWIETVKLLKSELIEIEH